MNIFITSGRLTKDIEIQKSASGAFARITLAVDRQAKDAPTDFIPITVFGKTAENMAKYTSKGQQLIVTGHIQTGDYEKDGKKVYSTSLIADRVEFISSSKKEGAVKKETAAAPSPAEPEEDYAPIGEISEEVW